MSTELRDRAREAFRRLQDTITSAMEGADGEAVFREDRWERADGGGGWTRVLEGGAVLEKGGVNVSEVFGVLPEAIARERGPADDPSFYATGLSLVLHPRSPMIPTVHANVRYLERGAPDHADRVCWFGGGIDLTPYYLFEEDARHFHTVLREACDRHDPTYYSSFKRRCDEYFFLPHRKEARGVGGLFFDHLGADGTGADLEKVFGFTRAVGEAFLPSYLPIMLKRRGEVCGESERRWQLQRRSRYAEFNLVYDRGTVFGLKTGGRIESILMSLPPLCRWDYDVVPEEGSREAALLEILRAPRDWA